MSLHIFVDAGEICLVEHAEFNFLCWCRDDKVEGVTEDGGVGYAVHGGKVEEGEGLFEAVEDTDSGEEQVAFLAPSMRLDVECLVGLPVALGCCTGKLDCTWKNDFFASSSLYQAMMYRLGHGRRPRILALDYVLARCLLECPHDRLGGYDDALW